MPWFEDQNWISESAEFFDQEESDIINIVDNDQNFPFSHKRSKENTLTSSLQKQQTGKDTVPFIQLGACNQFQSQQPRQFNKYTSPSHKEVQQQQWNPLYRNRNTKTEVSLHLPQTGQFMTTEHLGNYKQMQNSNSGGQNARTGDMTNSFSNSMGQTLFTNMYDKASPSHIIHSGGSGSDLSPQVKLIGQPYQPGFFKGKFKEQQQMHNNNQFQFQNIFQPYQQAMQSDDFGSMSFRDNWIQVPTLLNYTDKSYQKSQILQDQNYNSRGVLSNEGNTRRDIYYLQRNQRNSTYKDSHKERISSNQNCLYFDVQKSFTNYFPHNNIELVMKQFSFKNKKKKELEKQNNQKAKCQPQLIKINQVKVSDQSTTNFTRLNSTNKSKSLILQKIDK